MALPEQDDDREVDGEDDDEEDGEDDDDEGEDDDDDEEEEVESKFTLVTILCYLGVYILETALIFRCVVPLSHIPASISIF